MKKLFTLIVIAAMALTAFAQSPQKMSYQCVVRNSSGALVANQAVGMKISILQGSATTGTVVFSETYSPVPQTNANGLVTIEIGGGTAVTGTFSGINWASGPFFLKTETDPAGGTSYTITGTSQLSSVPYALYAKTAANGFSGAWADLTGRPAFATVATSGSYSDLLNRPAPFSGSYNDLTNRPVLFDGTWTSLSSKPVLFDGTWTSLTGKPVLFDGTWTSLSGKPAGFTDGIDNVDDADNSITNEIQALSLSGTVLSLSSGGGSVTLPSSGGGDNWGTQTVVTNTTMTGVGTTASPLAVANSVITPSWSRIQGIPAGFADGTDNFDDADNSITNEIQALSLSGTTLTLSSGGGSVTLPSSDGGDNWGTQVVVTDASLAGNGTTATPLRIAENGVSTLKILNSAVTADKLATNSVTSAKIAAAAVTGDKIAQAGATAGQALKWNGATWAPAADATGSGSGGWTDDGTIIRLSTATDSVQMGSVTRLGKFNVGGNIGLTATSNIFFGSDATRITGLIGGDLRLVAEDLSMLTSQDITFGRLGDATWIIFDNANKRVGIGTLTPSDKLHVVLDNTASGLSAVRGVATSAAGAAYGVYGQSAGSRGRGVVGEATGTSSIGVMGLATNTSSTGVWGEGYNQGVYGFSTSTTGKGVYGRVTSAAGYSGYFEGGKFLVKGSAHVEDTLYANVVNASKITIMPGLAHSSPDAFRSFTTSWSSMASVTFNVPAPGYVLLFASLDLIHDHSSGDITEVSLGFSKTTDGSGINVFAKWYISSYTSSADADDKHYSGQAPMEVTSAGSQTFHLMGYRKGGDGYEGAFYNLVNFTAVYFPVAYGTVD